jgi:SDR family mycofactocin-dependent oxidoreductase
MGRVAGKVALVTGAARGQGRSHCQLLAAEGADIVAIDICHDIENLGYPMGTSEELAETIRLVEKEDRRIIAREADVRDAAALERIVEDAYAEFGKIDIVCANAGIVHYARTWEIEEELWDMQVDVIMKGVWQTCKAVVPRMIEANNGGSIVITSSLLGLCGEGNTAAYSAAKAGNVAMAQALAKEVAPYGIRVNTIHPTAVNTDINNKHHQAKQLFRPDITDREPTQEEFGEACATMNLLPIPWVESIDISYAVLYLASEESRYVTGLKMSVDAGANIK